MGCCKLIYQSDLLNRQAQLTKKLGQVSGEEKLQVLKQIQDISKQIQKGKMEG